MFDLLLEDCAFRRRKVFLFVFGKDSKQIDAFVFFEVDITDADTAALSTMLILNRDRQEKMARYKRLLIPCRLLCDSLEKILSEDDGLLARGADGDDAEGDARDLRHALEILARVLRQFRIAADA